MQLQQLGRVQQRALERQTAQEERYGESESEKETFKSLVKLWDSSRSSYATVRLTHMWQHTHTLLCITEHETQRFTETSRKVFNIKSPLPTHTHRKNTQSCGTELTVLSSGNQVLYSMSDHVEAQLKVCAAVIR